MSESCTQIGEINMLKINMAKFETKLDANVATSARIEGKLDQYIEQQRHENKEMVRNFSEEMRALANNIANQINAHAAASAEAIAEQVENNKKEYAGKWIEKATVKALWVMLTPILGSVGYFLYKILTSPVMGFN